MPIANLNEQPDKSVSLMFFFVATFVVSWAFWVPAALLFDHDVVAKSPLSSPLFIVLQTLGAAGPSVVAYWLLRRAGRQRRIRSIVLRYRIWRVDFRWYLVAALIVPATQLAGFVAGGLLQGGPLVDPESALAEMLTQVGVLGAIALFPVIVVAQLPSSPLLEEFGWRGFALPRLQDRHSALTSSVILGFLWGIWHLPLTLAYGDSIVTFLLKITAVSVLITWVFNSTRGSMLIAMLFHASLNASIVPFASEAGRWPGTLLAVAAAVAVCAVYGGRDLAGQPRLRWSGQGERHHADSL